MKKAGINRTAVDNFLGTLDGLTASEAFGNLNADARSYGWNAATRTAISNGIAKHFQAKRAAGRQ